MATDGPTPDPYGTTGPSTSPNVSDAPTIDRLITAMEGFKPLPRPDVFVLSHQTLGVIIQATADDLIAWTERRREPSILNDFDRWWAAQLFRRGLIPTVYRINGEMLFGFRTQHETLAHALKC